MKVSPDKKVTVVAENFEADQSITKGPNDLIMAKNGTLYFTDPNGYYGDAPNGKTSVFNADITGPNSIVLSANERILYVSHNVSKTTSKIEQWSLKKDGSAGERTTLATVENCAADGMAVDKQGAPSG
jgi:gluconolactonase